MADKIVVMRDGVVEQVGRPLDLYDRPANQFVAGFLGSPAMNFGPGRIENGRFRSQSGQYWDGVFAAPDLEGRNVVFGIRPEHLRISAIGVPGAVQFVENKGAETDVVVDLGGVPVTCFVRERLSLAAGEATRLQIDAQHGHFFDAASGVRIGAPLATRQAIAA